jgi:hypothetical protein
MNALKKTISSFRQKPNQLRVDPAIVPDQMVLTLVWVKNLQY